MPPRKKKQYIQNVQPRYSKAAQAKFTEHDSFSLDIGGKRYGFSDAAGIPQVVPEEEVPEEEVPIAPVAAQGPAKD